MSQMEYLLIMTAVVYMGTAQVTFAEDRTIAHDRK
jgi:hypothetical protein